MEIYDIAVISTAHLPQHEMEALSTLGAEQWPFTVAPYEEGVIVTCHNVTGVNAPHSGPYATGAYPQIHALRVWAESNGYAYLCLDRDAGRVSELAEWEW